MSFDISGHGAKPPIEGQPEGARPEKRGRQSKDKKIATTQSLFTNQVMNSTDHENRAQNSQSENRVPHTSRVLKRKEMAPPDVPQNVNEDVKEEQVEQRNASFKTLGRDPIRKILSQLSKKDLQAVRVERYMDDQVVSIVKGNEVQTLNKLTDFLTANLQGTDFCHQLKTPTHVLEALGTKNLDTFKDALYAERARLIDLLSRLDEDALTVLQNQFQNSKLNLPATYNNLFELARIAAVDTSTNEKISKLGAINEWNEAFRMLFQPSHSCNLALISDLITTLLDPNSPAAGVEQVGRATFRLLLKQCELQNDSSEKPWTLFMIHLASSVDWLVKGEFDAAFNSLSTALEFTENPIGEKTREDALGRFVPFFLDKMSTTTIDNKSAIKIFRLIEDKLKSIPDSRVKDEVITKVYAYKLKIFAAKGFIELQSAMNKALEHIEHLTDPEAKVKAVQTLFGDKRVFLAALFQAVKVAKESDAKEGALVAIYAYSIQHPNMKPSLANGNLTEHSIEALRSIQDQAFQQAVRNTFMQE